MESLLAPLAAAALLFPIAFLAVPPALSAWRRRREMRRVFKPRSRPTEKIVLPSADETAASVERFHEAVRRSELADFFRPEQSGLAPARVPQSPVNSEVGGLDGTGLPGLSSVDA